MTTSPTSIRRKPVSYLSSEEIPFPPRSNYLLQQGSRAGSSVTLPSFVLGPETDKQEEDKPPVYILDVDLDVPVPATDTQAEGNQTPTLVVIGGGDQSPTRPSTPPPTYAYPPTSPSSSHSAPTLPLPTYTATPSTEPTTLPRQLFTYGFLCPLLWALGAVLLCVPLKVYEEDFDLDFEARRGGRNAATSLSTAGVTEQERAEDEGRLQGMKERERELLDEKVLILRRVSPDRSQQLGRSPVLIAGRRLWFSFEW